MNEIIFGDCLEVMRGMEPNSVDAVVTDPPYGLKFMGKSWDHGLPGEPFWAEALRVAKPGAHLLAFGGTRTFHRLTCAIEDAGWEIRDCLGWLYGSGFPKSESVSLAIDKRACRDELKEKLGRNPTKGEMKAAWEGYRVVVSTIKKKPSASSDCNEGWVRPWAEGKTTMDITAPATDAARKWEGWGTALKPAWEPIILARKPLCGTVAANVQKWGTGAINVDGCRVETDNNLNGGAYAKTGTERDDGWGMQRAGAGEYRQPKGRWPANLLHDGSEEVLELFPQTTSVGGKHSGRVGTRNMVGGYGFDRQKIDRPIDSGSAARFFKACPFEKGEAFRFAYCAKASRKEREMGCEGMEERDNGEYGLKTSVDGREGRTQGNRTHGKAANHHPTVKPLSLMRYLCRLVTPPKGLVLDPFCGSGSTLIAAKQGGFNYIGIDNNSEYCEIAKKRVGGLDR